MLRPLPPGPVIGSAAGLWPSQNVYKGDFVFWEILAERRNGEECHSSEWSDIGFLHSVILRLICC